MTLLLSRLHRAVEQHLGIAARDQPPVVYSNKFVAILDNHDRTRQRRRNRRVADRVVLRRLRDSGCAIVILDGHHIAAIYVSHPPVSGLAFHEPRSEEHTSELQSLMRITYAVL